MPNFFKNSNGGGYQKRGGFGGSQRGGFGGGQRGGFRGPKPMHPAVCSQCGNDCQVPFRPNGLKPVQCQDCFRPEEGGFSNGRDRAREFDERPRAFASRGERSAPAPRPAAPSNDEVVRQLKQLNEKMDELLDIVAAFVVDDEGEEGEEMEDDMEEVLEADDLLSEEAEA